MPAAYPTVLSPTAYELPFPRDRRTQNLGQAFLETIDCKFGGDRAIWQREEAIFVPAQKCPYHVIFDLDLYLEDTLDARWHVVHHVQVWWRSGHLPARRSDFRASTKVPVSRELWPWPWPWAHPGCTLTWSPSCASLVTIQPFAREKKRFAQKFTDGQTDGQTTDAARLYKLMEWAN